MNLGVFKNHQPLREAIMTAKIIHFASDNVSGTHPDIVAAMLPCLTRDALPYGEDSECDAAKVEFKNHFGKNAEVFFGCCGTAANVMAMKHCMRDREALLCSDVAHIHTTECGSFEAAVGAKIYPMHQENGKITPTTLKATLKSLYPVRNNKPTVLSLTQSTEFGTVYSVNELRELCALAHENNLIVHMDGARLANAAATLNKTLKEISVDVGIDVLSLGSTKNGLLMAEAVVFFKASLAEEFLWTQKQFAQNFSKMAFVGAQFAALFKNNLWLRNAQNANQMAQLLLSKIKNNPHFTPLFPIETNILLLKTSLAQRDALAQKYHFYSFNEDTEKKTTTIRLVTSFQTTKEQIEALAECMNSP